MSKFDCGVVEGERLKRSAFALLAVRREALIRRSRRALLNALLHTEKATIDDVRAFVPLPEGLDAKAFGPVPGHLAELGIIEQAGYAKSGRPEAHARPVAVWRLVDREGAKIWLAANPEIPVPVAPIAESLFAEINAPGGNRGHG